MDALLTCLTMESVNLQRTVASFMWLAA